MTTRIVGIDGMTLGQLNQEVANGGHFVFYQYTISVIVMTFRRSSAIYYIPPGQSRMAKAWPFLLITLLLGWWGIPWGPIYSIGSLVTNFGGGKIVTEDVLAHLFSAPGQEVIPATRIEHAETGYVPPEQR